MTQEITKIQQGELFDPPVLSRRKLPKFKKNPFVDDHLINQLAEVKNVYFTQSTRNAIVDCGTGEIEPAQLQVVKKVRADKEQFVKIYTTHLKAFFELSAVAYKLLQYVLYTIQTEAINNDKIYLSLGSAQDFFTSQGAQISKASYYRGLKELVEKLFIAEAFDTNVFFINPKLFFNGDRVDFITRFYTEDTKHQITEEQKKRLEEKQ